MENEIQIRKERDNLIQRYGAWTAHCIYLGEGIYTFNEPQVPQADSRLRRCLQVVTDMVTEPLDQIRVLDLACLEGMFAIELALHGAKVLGIEGREVNLAKAKFVQNTLSLNKLELIRDDVRNLNPQRFGSFDVILVFGILYHLDTPDVMGLMQQVYECCERAVIIDTNISLEPNNSYTWKGEVYWGTYWEEHRSGSTEEEQLDALWASIGNQRSFTLTRASLCNLLRHIGFTSVYECLNPYEYHNPNWPLAVTKDRHVIHRDRATFVAMKGQHQRVMSSPITQAMPEINRPEYPEYSRPVGWRRKILASLPAPTARLLRKYITK